MGLLRPWCSGVHPCPRPEQAGGGVVIRARKIQTNGAGKHIECGCAESGAQEQARFVVVAVTENFSCLRELRARDQRASARFRFRFAHCGSHVNGFTPNYILLSTRTFLATASLDLGSQLSRESRDSPDGGCIPKLGRITA